MSDLRPILADFDVHKLVETERRGFNESQNDVLRRLLGLGAAILPRQKASTGRPWSGDGVLLPHGTQLRMSYNGRTYTGEIADGNWAIEGKLYSSPSGAAGGVATTKKGQKTRLDGWIYWHVKRPEDADWTALQSLRPRIEVTLDDLDL